MALNIDNNLLNSVIFLELKTDFDTMNHAILLEMLASPPNSSPAWFHCYLARRRHKTVIA